MDGRSGNSQSGLTGCAAGSLGRASGIVDADVAAGSYEYHVEDVDADRILVRGPCTIRAVIAPAA